MAGVEEDGEEVIALREALRQHALAVEKLKVELEEERQAASSGADEALAMILRLQAEKAAERMEAEQFRRMAEERILHDGDSLAFLKALVFHQEMDLSSLKLRLQAISDPYSPTARVDLPWLKKLAKNGVSSRRNASLPAARLEELCSDLDAGGGCEDGNDNSRENVGDGTRPARTASDLGEVIRRENEWARSNASHLKAPPRQLHRSASNRLRRAPSYPAQCGPYQGRGGVHDKFEAPESVASHAPARSSRRAASPEIISEEDDQVVSSAHRAHGDGDGNHTAMSIAELGAAIHQIKAGVQSLATELGRARETSTVAGDAQARLLVEIGAKLDAIAMNKHQVDAAHGHGVDGRSYTSREEGSSSSKSVAVSVQPQSDQLLMNHFIEAMMYIP